MWERGAAGVGGGPCQRDAHSAVPRSPTPACSARARSRTGAARGPGKTSVLRLPIEPAACPESRPAPWLLVDLTPVKESRELSPSPGCREMLLPRRTTQDVGPALITDRYLRVLLQREWETCSNCQAQGFLTLLCYCFKIVVPSPSGLLARAAYCHGLTVSSSRMQVLS